MNSRVAKVLGVGAYLVLAAAAFLAAVSTILSYYVFIAFPALVVCLAVAWRYWHGRTSRRAFVLGTGLLGFMASILVFPFYIPSPPAPFWIRNGMIHRLEKAQTPEDRDQVAGSRGLHLRFAEGSWLAIDYEDSHAWPAWSLAIGCDSDGAWYLSTEHYCGTLAVLDPRRDPQASLPPSVAALAGLRSAAHLADAKAVMLEGGFRRMKR
ncbi:MAG: hypothetical protein KJ579_12615 [Verrucomicrobia bacterium]|nr:hypothetical protein [Verrucomicrobiota bacterium]